MTKRGATTKASPKPTPRAGFGPIAPWLASVAVVVAGLLAYSNSFKGVLIGDDEAAIAQNTTIRSLSATVFHPPADTTVAARPVANLTFAINYALAGGTTNLWTYHAFNLVIHLLTALFLFGLIRRTLESPALRGAFNGGSTSLGLALAVSAVWVAHPLHTQAVTFLAQRVEALMGLFYVATIYCVVRAAESGFRSQAWVAAAIVVCALGMGTKETMITAPAVAALWVWICWPDERLLGRPRTLLLGLAVTMAIAIALAMQGARSGSAGIGAGGWTSLSYLRTQAGVIVHYIRLAFWPHPLVFQYGWLPAASWSAVLPQVLLLAALAIGTVLALVRRQPIGLAGAWFFLILAPSSSIIPVSTEVAAEHRMYLPLAAILAVLIVGIWIVVRSKAMRSAVLAISAILCVALGVATFERNAVYASAESIAADVVQVRPENAQAQLTYGTYLVGAHRYGEAEPHLRTAATLPLPPSTDESKMRSLAHLYLGMALLGEDKTGEGAHELEQAIALRADLDRAYPLLAEAQLSQRQPAAAVSTLDRALARQPDDVSLLKRVAWILATSSDPAARNGALAVKHAERAIALTDSRDPVALDVLAAAHAEAGEFDAALSALAQAVALVRANGPADLVPTLRSHLELFEARRPVRTKDW